MKTFNISRVTTPQTVGIIEYNSSRLIKILFIGQEKEKKLPKSRRSTLFGTRSAKKKKNTQRFITKLSEDLKEAKNGVDYYRKQSEVDEIKNQLRLAKPEVFIRCLNKRDSLNNSMSFCDFKSHFCQNSLKLCSNSQDYLPLIEVVKNL